jgi:hypothetical protein
MNREQAKSILRSYRPGEQETEDAQLRQALELLEHDPELSTWFAEEQAVDARLSKSFQQFPLPPDLKGQLLAARKVVSPPLWWRRPAWISAAAACVALLGALAILFTRSAAHGNFSEFRSFVADTAASLDHLDLETSDYQKIQEWLQGHSAPNTFTIRGKLNAKSSVGCRLFQWNEQKVSLVCFEIGNHKVAHLFVMDRSALSNSPVAGPPQFSTARNGIGTASWSDGSQVYVLALKDGEQELRQLLL